MELGLVIYSPASLGWPRAPLPSRILMGESRGGIWFYTPSFCCYAPLSLGAGILWVILQLDAR